MLESLLRAFERPGAFVLTSLLIGAPSCKRCASGQDPKSPSSEARATHAPVEIGKVDPVPISSSRHRIVLDRPMLERLRASAERDSPAWKAVEARCDAAAGAPIASGYQGFEWAEAVASLSLCWHATGKGEYAEVAAGYVGALLDDRFTVGDKKGGADVVTHDSGYGIRTFGVYSALAYDWLRGAPGMTPELRRHIVERLDQWLEWYAEKGYLKDKPISNYFWGYLTTLALAGLAVHGEAPEAKVWLDRAKDELLAKRVLPTFEHELRGGNWPEGWQYGEYTGLEVGLVAKAFQTAAGVELARKLPWLGQVVTHHVHALLPDKKSVYDGGTWGEHPAKPSALALTGVVLALEGIDDARVGKARYLIARDLPPLHREQAWAALLIDRAEAPEQDPRQKEPASLHVQGSGLTFARSDWSSSAVWTSFQAGPWLAEDHQDKDQGHFELWRGGDALLVDGGDSEGSATINHNTLLIDDGGRHLDYTPNQGVWGYKVKTARFGDDGSVMVATGDIGEAYAPSCVREGCDDRSVKRLIRTFVYVRPALVVIDDRVSLDKGKDGVVWAAHVTKAPTIAGNLASAVIGQSRVDIRTLEPADSRPSFVREPNGSGDGPHRTNKNWGPMWRIEVASPRGSADRGFMHFITVDAAGAAPPPSRLLSGEGLRAAVGANAGKRTAVVFASTPEGGAVALEGATELVTIVGLDPGKRYRVDVAAGDRCTLRVRPASDGDAMVATSGGFVRTRVSRCDKP
jgi:hypothetical protein